MTETYSKKHKYKKLKEKYLTHITYSQNPFKPDQKLYCFYQIPEIVELMKSKDIIEKLSENFLKHKFNLLGSGWTEVKTVTNEEIEGSIIPQNTVLVKWKSIEHPNFIEQKKISDLVDKDYKLIDWQIDFKSGYRWDENTWFKDIKFGNVKGADIKVPWELGRMEHLELLIKEGENAEVILKEYQDQILDFISSNPPGFGVQWSSSMDVAIRAVNWLISYSIITNEITQNKSKMKVGDSATPLRLKKEFEYYFIRSIFEHGRHIIENLEWSSGMRGNHYLSNIAGLVFIASHLPDSDEINSWLIFSINELCDEILYQFNEDGSNFEASTHYHFFAAEIVFNSVNLILSLPKEKKTVLKNPAGSYYNYITKNYSIQAGLWEINEENQIILNDILINKLTKIYEFCTAIITESGKIPQIGDNDSGQLRITDYELLARDNINLLLMMKNVLNSINKIQIDTNLTYVKKQNGYNDFGLYILENKGIKVFIRCGSVGQKGKGGHSHNDQLSFELFFNNKLVIVDPGTYVYTSYPELRNEYRSTKMHNTLFIEGFEQNEWDNDTVDDLFWIKKDKSKAKMIEFSYSHFIGEHYGFPKPHKREIKLNELKITGIDYCNLGNTKFISFHFAPELRAKIISENTASVNLGDKNFEICSLNAKLKIEKYFYSPRYGVRVEAERLVIESQENKIEWLIEIK